MERDDISPNLVHFIKGESYEHSFAILKKILNERQLLGGIGYIKGEFRCVCFSEAPVHHLGRALMQPTVDKKPYRPFGVMIPKSWLFSHGGRPVIYQSDAEYHDLPDAIKWRHVRYEPDARYPVDFSWEREWRIHKDSLALEPKVARIVLPNEEWHHSILREHDLEETFNAQMYQQVIGESAGLLIEDFAWDAEIIDRMTRMNGPDLDF